jgi:hypothetical protein
MFQLRQTFIPLLIVIAATPPFNPYKNQVLPPVSNQSTLQIIVTNNSDVSDGDTSSVPALITSPGPDGGVSLREAIEATNHTTGEKIITFAPALKGTSIQIGAAQGQPLPILLGGELTIDGDIDSDGTPDVTLDASLRGGPLGGGIYFWSSNNTIRRLHLRGCNYCISAAVPNADVPQQMTVRTISNIQILSNQIDSPLLSDQNATAILLGPLGWIRSDQKAALSNITYQNFIIDGNQIDMPKGIFFYAGSGAGGNNRFSNVTVQNNVVNHGGIGFLAGDANTVYSGNPPPPAYSDNNIVEDVSILNNTVTNFKYGAITFGAGNQGNHNNIVRRVLIAGNTVIGKPFPNSSPAGPGIFFCAGCDSSLADRVTSGNVITDVEIRDNILQNLFQGIEFSAGEAWEGPGDIDNHIARVKVTNNVLTNIGPTGIVVVAGLFHHTVDVLANNSMDDIRITGNQISVNPINLPGEGIHISGGWHSDFYASQGPAYGNTITGLFVSQNTVTGFDVGISISGGDGLEITGNSVSGFWNSNQASLITADNLHQATNNHLIFQAPFQVYLPLLRR